MEGEGQIGMSLGLNIFQLLQHHPQMPPALARRNIQADPVTVHNQAEGIMLHHHQIGQGCRQIAAIFQLGHRALVPVIHGSRSIQQQITAQVGLLFVLFHVEFVTFGQNLPVQMPRIDAGGIFTVFGKLHRKAAMGGTMLAGKEPFHNQPRRQAQILLFRQCSGVQILRAGT